MWLEIETAARAVSTLDARLSAISVKGPWLQRAAWCGYARALQLQGVEIDEIDVFSWGCGVTLPARQRRTSHLNEFDDFAPWLVALTINRGQNWRDMLPFRPDVDPSQPRLLQAIHATHQFARCSGGVQPWLHLPIALKGVGFTENVLPCLAGGAKILRKRVVPADADIITILRAMASAADRGLELLASLERLSHSTALAIRRQRRPGLLSRVGALSLRKPILSPAVLASELQLSISGAGKLLERAAGLGLLVEISNRPTWKVYLVPDLAIKLGLRRAKLGRPTLPPISNVSDRSLAETLAAFDREMAEFDRRYMPNDAGSGRVADADDEFDH